MLDKKNLYKLNMYPFEFLLRFLNRLNKTSKNNKKFFLLFLDILTICISFVLVNFFYLSEINYLIPIWIFPAIIFTSIFVYSFTGQYNSLTRYLLTSEIFNIALRNILILISLIFFGSILKLKIINFKVIILFWIINTFLNIIFKFALKELLDSIGFLYKKKINKVAIYGAGAAGAQLASSLLLAGNHKIEVFFDDSSNLWGRKLLGIKILSPMDIFKYKERLDQILFAIPSLDNDKTKIILKRIKEYEIPVLQVPSIQKLTSGKAKIDTLQPIDINDLLGRIRVEPFSDLLEDSSKDQNILITGAGGTIGKEIFSQIIKLSPKSVVLVENSEINLYNLEQEFHGFLKNNKNIYLKLGDVKNYNFNNKLLNDFNIDVIYHAAAYKHVPLIESNPLQGIENNVLSTYSICKSAESSKVKRVTLISSDKAVRPTNVMGASKRLAELVVKAFSSNLNNTFEKNIKLKKPKTKYSIVRFGNVLNSSGSVVPLFQKQIASGGPITLTDKNIIRYFMTVSEAAQLVIQATTLSKGGEIFLLDMGEPIRIEDLAKQMVRLSGLNVKNIANPGGDIEIISTGLRPGEKLYEELLIDGKSESTIHPLIFKSKEKEFNYKELMQDINKLIKSLDNLDEELSLSILQKLVPEWIKSF